MNDMAAQAYLLSSETLAEIIEFRGNASNGHVGRIRVMSRILLEQAARCGGFAASEQTIEKIAAASLLHDLGKISVPERVLLKPDRLSLIEYRMMQSHPVKGWEMLQAMTEVADPEYHRYCCDICRSHHERWDGGGYPDRLEGDQIPFWAQVVSLADVYDALISRRVYKPAFTHEKASAMIVSGECGVFGSLLLDCFLKTQEHLCSALLPLRE